MNRDDTIVPLAGAAFVVLATMVGITAATGVSQESFQIVRPAAVYHAELLRHATPLRALYALDSVFLVLYATLLVQVASWLGGRLVALGIGAVLVTAGLDIVEDQHTLALLRGAGHGVEVTSRQVSFQQTLSQVKFHVSYLGLFVLGLQVPRASLAGQVLAGLLTVGTLAQGAWLFVAPAERLPALDFGRWLGFLLGFVLIIRVRRAGAGATGAPA